MAWIEVQRCVQQEAVDLVAVGPFLGPHLGSTESLLMACSQVPLCLVKVPERVAQAPCEIIAQSLFGRVLYATDWSTRARQAQDYLLGLKPLGLGEVLVAHVVTAGEVARMSASQRDSHRLQVQQQLAQSQRELAEAGFSTRSVLLEGEAAHELVSLARREEVALVVMGATDAGKTTERTLGSVSAAVARTTEHSILLI